MQCEDTEPTLTGQGSENGMNMAIFSAAASAEPSKEAELTNLNQFFFFENFTSLLWRRQSIWESIPDTMMLEQMLVLLPSVMEFGAVTHTTRQSTRSDHWKWNNPFDDTVSTAPVEN